MKTKLNWLELLLLAAPFVVLAIYWSDLPARVPLHWGMRGEVDWWSAKFPGLLVLPLTALGLALLLHRLRWLDPKMAGAPGVAGRMPAILPPVRITLLALFDTIFFLQITVSLGKEIAVGRILICATLLVFIVLGNYLGNLRPNYFIGIRTPWTLESPETWRATHRLGGRFMFFGGIGLLIAQFFLEQQTLSWLLLIAILALASWGILYSWHHFRTHAAAR
jgi:uncharacterized membrane protein